MVRITGGKLQMRTPPPLIDVLGQSRGFERPFKARPAEVKQDFYLAQFEVTNGMYRQFVKETSYRAPHGEMLDIDRVYQGTINPRGKGWFQGQRSPSRGTDPA